MSPTKQIALALGLASLAILPPAARADSYLIVGEFVDGSLHAFALENQKDYKSVWVVAGDTVGLYTFESYDPSAKVATLRHDVEVIHVGWRLTPHEEPQYGPLSLNSKERWAPIIKKEFENAGVVFFAEVIPSGSGVIFKCVRVLKSAEGEPLVGQILEFNHIDIPNVTDGLNALVFLKVYPPTVQDGPEFKYFRGGLFRGHSFTEVLGWISDEGTKSVSK